MHNACNSRMLGTNGANLVDFLAPCALSAPLAAPIFNVGDPGVLMSCVWRAGGVVARTDCTTDNQDVCGSSPDRAAVT